MTAATPAQLGVWQSYQAVARRLDLEVKTMMLELEQLKTLHDFKTRKGLTVNFDPIQIAADAKTVFDKNEKLKTVIFAINTNELGLRFRGNELDVMAPAGTTDDQITPYHLSAALLVIVIGVVVATSIIAYMAALRQQNYELHRKVSTLVDVGDSMLCADSSSPQCEEWKQEKEREGWNRRENVIDQTKQQLAGLPDKVKTLAQGLGIGFAVAAVAVAGFLLWDKKKSR